MRRILLGATLGLLVVAGVLAVAATIWLYTGGIGATRAPGRIETAVARRLRSLAIPGAARVRTSPLAAMTESVRDGMAHFADHCAVCHANNGSGDTEMGRGLYPRPPDMRQAATQSLSDGELFFIIEHGVRMTGMPGWGDGSAESEASSWRLVHFIRHLPNLSAAELSEMEALNPRSPDEWRADEEERRFLEGPDAGPAESHGHKHGGRR